MPRLRRADLRLRGGDRREPRPPLRARARGPGDRRRHAVLGQYRPPPPRRPHRLRRQPAALREMAARPRRAPAAGSYRQELFVNAWNEWAEKAVLEPSQQYGRAYLDALAALRRLSVADAAPPGPWTPHVPDRPARRHPQDRDHHSAGHAGAEPPPPRQARHRLPAGRPERRPALAGDPLDPAAGALLRQPAGAGELAGARRAATPPASRRSSSAARSSPAAARAVDMRELAGLLAAFGRRTVVCVLRNQLTYLQSIYLQVTKEARGRRASRRSSPRRCAPTSPPASQLDYGALYDHLLTGFAPEEIVFLCYEAAVRGPGGIIGELFDRLGLGAAAAGLLPLAAGNSNVSPAPLAAWAANRISAPGVAGQRADRTGGRGDRGDLRRSRAQQRSTPAPRERGSRRTSRRSTPPSRRATGGSSRASRWPHSSSAPASSTAAS